MGELWIPFKVRATSRKIKASLLNKRGVAGDLKKEIVSR